MPGWVKHKLESRLPEEISIKLRYADDTTIMAESKEELKGLLMKVKELHLMMMVMKVMKVKKLA